MPDTNERLYPPIERWNVGLKQALKALDCAALTAAWGLAIWGMQGLGWSPPMSAVEALVFVGLGVVSGLATIASKRLWLARVCSLRSLELTLLGHVAVTSGLTVLGAAALLKDGVGVDRLVVAMGLSFTLLALFRGAYRSWLERSRKRGLYTRRMVIVGTNDEAAEWVALLEKHREAGFRVCGAVGPEGLDCRLGVPWLGEYSDVVEAMQLTGATGALIVSSAMQPDELNWVTRRILRAGGHVHLSSGLRGISHDRLRKMPVAYEPLLYVEQAQLARGQLTAKRAVDLLLSTLLLILALPVMVVAAAAIKLEGNGPLIYRQRRVGKDGQLFNILKLRTMSVDAETRLDDLAKHNQRGSGPLFKLWCDPRATRVGRVLRAASIDELPQLFNVLRGEMSLVGPRPALPSEAESFDDELRNRQRMLPGITGLWQVEARDDPDFASYRRFDLFYVENWSVGLDLSILLATGSAVFWRAVATPKASAIGSSLQPPSPSSTGTYRHMNRPEGVGDCQWKEKSSATGTVGLRGNAAVEGVREAGNDS